MKAMIPISLPHWKRIGNSKGCHSHLSSPFEVVEEYRPDLVPMDMWMPSCNGVEATRALRQVSACQLVPIVYVSSETDVALQVEAPCQDGEQFMTAPFNPEPLAAAAKIAIERYR